MAAALMLGLAGSWHCAAMCGGFTLAFRRGSALLAYLMGRWLGYATVGALLGGWGGLATQWLGSKLVLGVAALLLILMTLAKNPAGVTPQAHNGFSLTAFLWTALGPWLRQPGPMAQWGLGLATAIFPCGLLYAAWLQAAATSSWIQGMLCMSAFCMGTLPGLLAPRWLRNHLPAQWGNRIQSLAMLSAAAWMLFQVLLPDAPELHSSCGMGR